MPNLKIKKPKNPPKPGYLDKIIAELKNYFDEKKDEDFLEYDGHPLSDLESLLDQGKPAPWDHLTNTDDDEDIDIEIKEEEE